MDERKPMSEEMSEEMTEEMSEEPSEEPSEEQTRLREREELISALRNFAEHFGATEVYQQARAIYLETPAGRAEREQEAAASFDSILRDSGQPLSERPKRLIPGGRTGRGSSPLADAKKALGG